MATPSSPARPRPHSFQSSQPIDVRSQLSSFRSLGIAGNSSFSPISDSTVASSRPLPLGGASDRDRGRAIDSLNATRPTYQPRTSHTPPGGGLDLGRLGARSKHGQTLWPRDAR